MKSFWLSILTVFISTWVLAEKPSYHLSDTIKLDEIVFYGDALKYQPGAKIEKLSSRCIEVAQEGGLEQLLSRFMPVYTKGNAGGLTTIRFRGTSANHTTINFGGININSLTLGHSNLSDLSTFLFDRIDLQFGSSSALNGSGGIGGAIYLGGTSSFTKGVRIKLKTTIGSFGEQLAGAKIFIGNGKAEAVTRLVINRKDNDFPFKNPYHENRIIDRTPVDDIQKGAASDNKALIQELNYRFSADCSFKAMLWYEDSWHQIQPNMQSNLSFVKGEEISDHNLRFWSEFKNEEKLWRYSMGAGYVHDDQIYDNIGEQRIVTDRLILDGSVKRQFSRWGECKLGTQYKYIVPEVYSYSEDNIINEQHLDLYCSYFFEPVRQLKTTVSLRQMFVTGFKAPFTPSLVAEYTIPNRKNQQFTISGSVSRSYRIPTLNDRYWGDQGNPDLLPEDGFNTEAGIKYARQSKTTSFELKTNLFYMDINNWIEWRNYGVWKAYNVQRVVSKGIEFQSHITINQGNLTHEAFLNYTFNPVNQVENKTTGTATNQTLIYSPKHLGNISYWLKYKQFYGFIDGSFVGARLTDYLGSTLPPYGLLNIGLTAPFKYKKHELSFTAQVLNILNTQYQNEKYYAMPGRSFKISMNITLDFVKP